MLAADIQLINRLFITDQMDAVNVLVVLKTMPVRQTLSCLMTMMMLLVRRVSLPQLNPVSLHCIYNFLLSLASKVPASDNQNLCMTNCAVA